MRTCILFTAMLFAHMPYAQDSMTTMPHPAPLVVEVWSDVVCPFCYIGKRELERALERFPHRDRVRVEWKSFELDPTAPARSAEDTYAMLARKYGMSREAARQRTADVVARAATLGLHYDFDRVVLTNSFHAQRLIQLAKAHGLGDAAEELLFKAYFTEGADIGDAATLVRLAGAIGLDAAEAAAMLDSGAYGEAVRADEREAQQLGIRGVPFFVIDRKVAVSGAQSAEHFLAALQQAWGGRPTAMSSTGQMCAPEDADCIPSRTE